MLKRSAIFKALLIGILACVFLLISGGTARAEVVWDIDQDVIDMDNFIWWSDDVGTKYTGTSNGISWEAIITKPDVGTAFDDYSATDGIPGEVSFRITNASTLKGTVTIPDKLIIDERLVANWYEYTYIVTQFGTNEEKSNGLVDYTVNKSTGEVSPKVTGITGIKIGSYVTNFSPISFEPCTALTKIEVDSSNTAFSSQDGVLYNKEKTKLLKFPLAKSTTNFAMPISVNTIATYAFARNVTNDAKITIAQSVTNIDSFAFYNFKGLKTISFENEANVTSIGEYAFARCTSLEKFPKLPNITTISTGMFRESTNLNEIIIGDKVTSIGKYAFYKTKLPKIVLPESVKNIGELAFGYSSLIEANLSNVTSIENAAFKDCTSLKKVILSNDLTSLSNNVFYNCTKLENINMPNKLTAIGESTFYGTAIKSIELPKTVTSIGNNAFIGCSNLIVAVVPEGLKTVGTTIFDSTSKACNKNLIVYSTKDNPINAQTPAYIVYTLTEGENGFATLNSFKDNKGNITQINLLNKIYGLPVRVIGEGAFKGNTKLTAVTIPNSVTEIQKEAFSGCIALKELVLPTSLKTIGEKAFYNCTGMKTIIIPKGTPIESIGTDAFKNCTATICYDGTNPAINDYKQKNPSANIIVDTMPPTATIGKERPSGKYYMCITLSNIKDDASGAYKYVVTTKADASAITEAEWKFIEADIITADVKENGTIYVYIMDKMGNIAQYQVLIQEVDTIKPTVKVEGIEGGKVAKIKISFSDEGGSGLDSYIISMSDNVENVTTGWKNLSGAKATVDDTIDNNGKWYISVKDKAGWISEPTMIELDGKMVDSTAPVVQPLTYVVNSDINIYNGQVYSETIKYLLKDTGIGLAGYAIDTKEKADETTEWIVIEDKKPEDEFTYVYENNATYYIHAKDAYGNISNTPYIENKIQVDAIAPTVEFGKRDGNKVEIKLKDSFKGLAAGANIGYAFVSTAEEEPTEYITAKLTYKAGDKVASFKADGSNLTGNYFIKVKIATLKDVQGNENKEGFKVSGEYKFDNTAPTLTVSVSAPSVKENGKVTYTITASEDVVLNKDVKASITNDKFEKDDKLGTLGEMTGSGKLWTITLTGGTANSQVVLIVPKEMFKDAAGNVLAQDYKWSEVRVDNTNPELPTPTLDKTTVNSEGTAVYTFKTSEALRLVEDKAKEITLTGDGIKGTVVEVKAPEVDGKTWTITVKGGVGNGPVKLNLPQGLFTDEAGNSSDKQEISGLSFDNIAPTVKIDGPEPAIINKEGTAVYTITTSEKVELAMDDMFEASLTIEYSADDPTEWEPGLIQPVDISKISEDGKTWKVKVSNATGDGEATLTIAEGAFIDEAGNVSALTEKAGLTIDNTAPVITSVSEAIPSDDKESATIVITTENKESQFVISASENVELITEDWITASSTTLTDTVESNGDFYIYVKDIAGNIAKYNGVVKVSGIIDNKAPTVKIEAPTPAGIKTGNKATFKIITSEAVTNVQGKLATLEGEGSEGSTVTIEQIGKTSFVATVTAGSKEGEIKLVLPEGIFKDTSSNSTETEYTKEGLVVDNTAPQAEVKYEQTENGIKVIIIANEELSALEGWTLTKTNKENDTLVKEVTEDLSEVTVKDIAENELKVVTKVKFATSIILNETATVNVDGKKELFATIVPSDTLPESIKWESSNKSIVTVDSKGVMKGISKGTATITATSIKDAKVSSSCQVIVNEKIKVDSVTFKEEAPKELILGGKAELANLITIAPDNATVKDAKWSSSNTSVITVDENGTVKAVGVGEAIITVTADGGKTASLTIKVKEIDSTEVTGIELDKPVLRLVKGQTAQLNETVKPEELASTLQSVVWASSNEKIATVVNGSVTAVAAGEATITVTTINGGKSATCKVYVEESNVTLESIAFEKTSLEIVEGKSETLKVIFTPSNAINQDVTFESSDETIVTIDENGKLTAIMPGETTITATSEEGGFTATCNVVVTEAIPVEEIELDITTLELYTGDSTQINATVTPDNATDKEIIWTSSDENVVTVNANGKVTAVGVGTAIITASSLDGEITATCEVTITEFIAVESVTLDKESVDIMKNSDIILSATVNPENATNKKLTWSSDNEDVAKVEETEDGSAKVTGVGDGTAVITVTTEDGNFTATCNVTVTTGTGKVTGVKLSANEMTLSIGKTSQIIATVEPEDAANRTLIWKSSNENVATVDVAGNVTAIAEGTSVITVTTEDGNFTATCTITVVQQAKGFTDDAEFGMKTIDKVNYLIGIKPKVTIQSILDKLAEGYTAIVENADKEEISDYTKYASTDNTRITVKNETETITYIVVVTGDCTGDGLVTANDLIDTVKQFKHTRSNGTRGTKLEGAKLLAVKFTDKEEYTASDLINEVKMYKEWKNK